MLVTYRLVWNSKFVLEHVVWFRWYDRTLIYEGSTVEGVESMLVNTVPMLHVDMSSFVSQGPEMLTMDVTRSILLS
jgi:hypothetical protein